MSTYLTADTHFGHALMLREEACNRPYSTTDEMDEALIDNWNAIVHPKDTVWHLGDFAMRMDDRRVSQIFHALHGTKKLIIGNHDTDKKGNLLPSLKRLPWAEVALAAEITHDGQRIMLSHYAGYVWNAQHRGSYLAFGHSHGKVSGMPGSVDVGVDAQDFRPISAEEFVRQADYTIEHAEERIEEVCSRLMNKAGQYTEGRGAELYQQRKVARRAKP
ncbi:metallophosphoesterase [Mesorhizobium sp. A623]